MSDFASSLPILPFSPLPFSRGYGCIQYWLPGVGEGNETYKPKFELEYLTFTLPSLHPGSENAPPEDNEWWEDDGEEEENDGEEEQEEDESESRERRLAGADDGGAPDSEEEKRYPIPLKELPKSLRHGKTGAKSKYAPYQLADLTIGSWLKLGRKLGDKERRKLRGKFRRYMYMQRKGD